MLSIIIPVYNEYLYLSTHMETLLQRLNSELGVSEIFFVDGGSSDDTVPLLQQNNCNVFSSPKGRAVQMNYGVQQAKGAYIFFLFCDCLPEIGFAEHIYTALALKDAGCMSFCYDSNRLDLKLFSYIYGKPFWIRHKFGDSGIFVNKEMFLARGGFDETNIIEHDNQFINEMLDLGQMQQISCKLMVSPRMYEKHSFLKVSAIYITIHLLYQLGVSQQKLIEMYKKFLS